MESLPDEVLVSADETEVPFPAGPVRVLKDVRLLYLSLDLFPGPYGSVPVVRGREADVLGAFDGDVQQDALGDVLRDHPQGPFRDVLGYPRGDQPAFPQVPLQRAELGLDRFLAAPGDG